MTTIVEGRLVLEFDDTWVVTKWDDHRAFRNGIGKLCGRLAHGDGERDEGTKAVDVVGVRENRLYLIELKDFRGHRIENKQRQLRELPLEIGLKVRDSLAGLVACALGATEPGSQFVLALNSLASRERPHVVALIAEDPNPLWGHPDKRAAVASQRLQNLRTRLKWLTTRVWLEDPLSTVLPGVRVRNLAGGDHTTTTA